MNAWLRSWGLGFRFLDHWDLFWGRSDLCKRDRLYLNRWGTNTLTGRFAGTTQEDESTMQGDAGQQMKGLMRNARL